MLKRQKLQVAKSAATQKRQLRLIPLNSRQQLNINSIKPQIKNIKLRTLSNAPKIQLLAPAYKKTVTNNRAKTAYRSSKIRLAKAHVRDQLTQPLPGQKPKAPSIATHTDNVYPNDAYKQVEKYVDNLITSSQRGPPAAAYYNKSH